MAVFEYVAFDQTGKETKGIIEADNARQVRQKLRDKKGTPVSIQLASKQPSDQGHRSDWQQRFYRVNASDLALILRQLSTLIGASVTIDESLKAVAKQSDKTKIKTMMLSIRSKVLEGNGLANSLKDFPAAFPKLYRASISAGEKSGHLGLVLERLSDHAENSRTSQQKVRTAMIYPIMLMLISIGIISALLTYLFPKMAGIFLKNGQELPALTQSVLNISQFFQDYGLYTLICLTLGAALFWKMLKDKEIQFRFHTSLLRVPLLGSFMLKSNTAHFANTVAILTGSAVPLVEAMRIASQVPENLFFQSKMQEAIQMLSEGASMKVALESTELFSPMLLQMVASGESSGKLDEMLVRAAKHQEDDLSAQISTMLGLLQPFILLVMAFFVLVIVAAIMLPIVKMNNVLGA